MPTITKISTKPRKEITLSDIKASLRDHMIKKYGSVYAFARHDDAKEFNKKPEHISQYMSDAGGVSFSIFARLYEKFGLGHLDKLTVMTKTLVYHVTE